MSNSPELWRMHEPLYNLPFAVVQIGEVRYILPTRYRMMFEKYLAGFLKWEEVSFIFRPYTSEPMEKLSV